MTEGEHAAMRREDHAVLAVLGAQMSSLVAQTTKMEASIDAQSERIRELEMLVRAGGWAVKVIGLLGAGVIALVQMWPAIKAWAKGALQ